MSLFLPRIDAQEIQTGTLSRDLPETLPRALLGIFQLLCLWRARHRYRQELMQMFVCARLKSGIPVPSKAMATATRALQYRRTRRLATVAGVVPSLGFDLGHNHLISPSLLPPKSNISKRSPIAGLFTGT